MLENLPLKDSSSAFGKSLLRRDSLEIYSTSKKVC